MHRCSVDKSPISFRKKNIVRSEKVAQLSHRLSIALADNRLVQCQIAEHLVGGAMSASMGLPQCQRRRSRRNARASRNGRKTNLFVGIRNRRHHKGAASRALGNSTISPFSKNEIQYGFAKQRSQILTMPKTLMPTVIYTRIVETSRANCPISKSYVFRHDRPWIASADFVYQLTGVLFSNLIDWKIIRQNAPQNTIRCAFN